MTETDIFEIVTHAAGAKAEAYAALKAAQAGDFVKAAEHLKQSEIEAGIGHRLQTDNIQREVQGEKPEISLLLIHAQDLLMTAMTERDLIENMVEMHRTIHELTCKLEAGR